MIDPAIRLRRAIHMKDVVLVRRIVHAHPDILKNPDYQDKSNTSLHLAAELDCAEVAEALLDAGHDATEISLNNNSETPLMVAADKCSTRVGELLISRCSRCIRWKNKKGMDALSICASRPGSAHLIPLLLDHPDFPASTFTKDLHGDTPLHHASAAGSLKALRILLEHGADPSAKNNAHWTPLFYSQTVQAEVYFKQLIAEFGGARQASGSSSGAPMLAPLLQLGTREAASQSTSNLSKTITGSNDTIVMGTSAPMPGFAGRERGDSRESDTSNSGRTEAISRAEMMKRKGGGVRLVTDDGERPSTAGETAREWSPAQTRRAATPTSSRPHWSGFEGGRMRASSGD